MRVIAGSSGNRRAAPILLEMLRREQFFDGGKATGIVTTPRVIRDSQYSVGIKKDDFGRLFSFYKSAAASSSKRKTVSL